MKIRSGFVSNSSSSSFICDVCGEDVSGWDIALDEAEMYQCENGHTFCEEHAVNLGDEKEQALTLIEGLLKNAEDAEKDSYLKGYISEYKETIEKIKTDEDCDYNEILSDYEFRYEMPSKYCPICQMEVVTDDDMVKYLLKKHNTTRDVVKNNISEFNSYKDLKLYTNEKN